MVHHFINLVGYRNLNFGENDRVYIDTISLQIVCRLLRLKTERYSGVRYYQERDWSSALHLLPSADYISNFNHSVVLPIIKDVDQFNIQELTELCSRYEKIVICISSPKQNHLGRRLFEALPSKDIDIFCLGAAISQRKTFFIYDKVGLGWLVFAIQDFKRFKVKISSTVIGIFSITNKCNRDHLVGLIKGKSHS